MISTLTTPFMTSFFLTWVFRFFFRHTLWVGLFSKKYLLWVGLISKKISQDTSESLTHLNVRLHGRSYPMLGDEIWNVQHDLGLVKEINNIYLWNILFCWIIGIQFWLLQFFLAMVTFLHWFLVRAMWKKQHRPKHKPL